MTVPKDEWIPTDVSPFSEEQKMTRPIDCEGKPKSLEAAENREVKTKGSKNTILQPTFHQHLHPEQGKQDGRNVVGQCPRDDRGGVADECWSDRLEKHHRQQKLYDNGNNNTQQDISLQYIYIHQSAVYLHLKHNHDGHRQ